MTQVEQFADDCRTEFAFLVDEYGYVFEGPDDRRRRFVCDFVSPAVKVEIAYDPPDPNPSIVLHFSASAGTPGMTGLEPNSTEHGIRLQSLREIMRWRGASREELASLSRGTSRRPRSSRLVLASCASMLRKYGAELLRAVPGGVGAQGSRDCK